MPDVSARKDHNAGVDGRSRDPALVFEREDMTF